MKFIHFAYLMVLTVTVGTFVLCGMLIDRHRYTETEWVFRQGALFTGILLVLLGTAYLLGGIDKE